MNSHFLLCFLVLLSNLSCSNSSRQMEPAGNRMERKAGKIKKPSSAFSDTMKIDSPAAVFFNPDTLQLEQIKEITNKDAFETEVHNCFYLMRNARTVLRKYWPQVRIIETSRNRWLLFLKADKNETLIDLNSKGDMCGIFLFDGRKEPELADMMNIDTALGFYFSK